MKNQNRESIKLQLVLYCIVAASTPHHERQRSIVDVFWTETMINDEVRRRMLQSKLESTLRAVDTVGWAPAM